MNGLRVIAHDSGDGQTIMHCPFCGGGQVIGRFDGTVECEFCGTAFTVQVQPLFSGFPQTVNGMPFPIPGMPGQIGGPPAGPGADEAPPFGQDQEVDDNPFADSEQDDADQTQDAGPPPDDGDDQDDAPRAKDKNTKKSYRTANGARLSEAAYAEYLAIRHSTWDERHDLLIRLRAGRGSRRSA